MKVVELFPKDIERGQAILDLMKGRRFFAVSYNEERDVWESHRFQVEDYELLWNLEILKFDTLHGE